MSAGDEHRGLLYQVLNESSNKVLLNRLQESCQSDNVFKIAVRKTNKKCNKTILTSQIENK
jgi:hypothetical protein